MKQGLFKTFHLMNISVEKVIQSPEVWSIIREIYNAKVIGGRKYGALEELSYWCGKLVHHVTYILGHRNLKIKIDVKEDVPEDTN